MSDSVRPHRWQPTRLPCPWDSPGRSTGVGCHFLFQCMKVKSQSEVAQLCPTLSDPMDCSLPGSSIHRIFQGRVLMLPKCSHKCSYRRKTEIWLQRQKRKRWRNNKVEMDLKMLCCWVWRWKMRLWPKECKKCRSRDWKRQENRPSHRISSGSTTTIPTLWFWPSETHFRFLTS